MVSIKKVVNLNSKHTFKASTTIMDLELESTRDDIDGIGGQKLDTTKVKERVPEIKSTTRVIKNHM